MHLRRYDRQENSGRKIPRSSGDGQGASAPLPSKRIILSRIVEHLLPHPSDAVWRDLRCRQAHQFGSFRNAPVRNLPTPTRYLISRTRPAFMSESPDLLRDAEVLRKLLTECLRRVDRLERQLRIEAVSVAKPEQPPAPPTTDPFEQALPNDEPATGNESGPVDEPPRNPVPSRRPPPPRGQHGSRNQTIRTLPTSAPRRQTPEPPASPKPGPAASHHAPGPLDAFGDADDWNAEPRSGDGLPDPFALLDLSVPPTASHDANVSRAMKDLLGGLDIASPGDDA